VTLNWLDSTRRVVLFATLFCLSGSVLAENTNFSLDARAARRIVQFVSDAPLERIVGRADGITASFSVDLTNLTAGASGKVVIDMNSFDTGLSVRNQHMQVNHLQTERFPTAVFTLKSIASAEPRNISSGGTAALLMRGELDLHGVKKEYEILGTLTYNPADGSLRVQCVWPLSLHDHDIPRPAFLFMKLAETQEITIDLQFQK